MTNERMAELINEGGNDELLPLMWEKMRWLFRQWSISYYKRHNERCASAGVTVDDLHQQCYFAMLEGIKEYCSRREEYRESAFTSFCVYPFRKYAAEITGERYKRLKNEPLNSFHLSLDETTNFEDLTLGETIEDGNAITAFEAADKRIYTEQVHAILESGIDTLPQQEAAIIRALYWKNERGRQLARDYQVSEQRISQIKENGLKRLRRIKEIGELSAIRSPRTVSAQRQLVTGSVVEQEAERRERLRGILRKELSES